MASKTSVGHLKYQVSDYITKLYEPEDEAVYAIADLIEDLHKDKNTTVNHIIEEVDVEALICQLFKLLQASLPIVVGNTAYILGTLAEFEECRSKIINILSLEDADEVSSLDLLISLLDTDDPETLINVTGTIGSLVESSEGRQFILSRKKCFSKMLVKVNGLLKSSDLWIGSNAALIIARVTIDEDGNKYLLNSSLLYEIIENLVSCLSIDTAGRGMNSAFALGRIFDNGPTIESYYAIIFKLKFIEKLVNMTECSEMAFVKNSCFCLSSLMESEKGFNIVIMDSSFAKLVWNLEALLTLSDEETIWFAILTLKIISKKPPGCKLLRNTRNILHNIKKCMNNQTLSEEVKGECQEIINNLTPLEKPPKPNVELISCHEVLVTWSYPILVNYLEITSFLYYKQNNDQVLAYRGNKKKASVRNLESNQKYEFFLKFENAIEITLPSDTCFIMTAEDYPSPPTNLHVIVNTSNQIKIGWDEPEYMNGTIKHYIIQTNKKIYEQTNNRSSIISGLQPETKYNISVSAVNACGKGSPVELETLTLSTGAHATSKPSVNILGRSVAHLTWDPPEAPLGKIFRYDVKINQKTLVYSGIQTYCNVTNLKPDTEYSFSVIVITSEGKYESPICRKRTGKDEYVRFHRAPLYECNMKSDSVNCSPNQKFSPKFPLNSIKSQRNSLVSVNSHNSDIDLNPKTTKSSSAGNLIRLPPKNISNSEYLKQNLFASKANINESPQKLQPLLSFEHNWKSETPKSLSETSSHMSSYTNSLSIPLVSSIDIDAAPNHFKCLDKITGIIMSNMSNDEEDNSNNSQSSIVDRCRFRKISFPNNNDLINIPVKNHYPHKRNPILQRKQSKALQ